MTDEQFCAIHSAFTGEKTSHVKQIVIETFSGEELKEYVEFHMKERDALPKQKCVVCKRERPESEMRNVDTQEQNSDESDTQSFKMDVIGSNLDFTPANLSYIFRNLSYKPCNSPGYDFAWDVTENGKFVGELFYSNEFREWSFIKDNYPSPRRAFNTTFPMNTDFFIKLFKAINIDLKFTD